MKSSLWCYRTIGLQQDRYRARLLWPGYSMIRKSMPKARLGVATRASGDSARLIRLRGPRLHLRSPLGLDGDRRFADHLGERAQRVLHAGAGRARYQQRGLLRRAFQPVLLLLQFFRADRVDLVQRDDLDFVRELFAIGFQFGAHRLVGLPRMLRGRIHQMQQHAAALDMAQEAVAEPGAFMRAFDQPWNVREYEFAPIRIHHP